MGLTSCRRVTIAKYASTPAARVRNRRPADCRVAVAPADDRYTLICDGPLNPDQRQR